MTFTKKRNVCVAAVILICISLLCSFFFIAGFTGHDCEHEDCPVCRVIDVCLHLIRGILPVFLVQFSAAASVMLLADVLSYAPDAPGACTLVSLKIKLLD